MWQYPPRLPLVIPVLTWPHMFDLPRLLCPRARGEGGVVCLGPDPLFY